MFISQGLQGSQSTRKRKRVKEGDGPVIEENLDKAKDRRIKEDGR